LAGSAESSEGALVCLRGKNRSTLLVFSCKLKLHFSKHSASLSRKQDANTGSKARKIQFFVENREKPKKTAK
jgi:hypothetical protein